MSKTNNYSDKEYKLIILRLWNPFFLIEGVLLCLKIFIRLITNRLLRGYMINYPQSIRKLAKKISVKKENEIILPFSNNFDIKKLKLATGSLSYREWPDWDISFDSHEQFVSLHRWNWLLRSNTDRSKVETLNWGFAMIRSWLDGHSLSQKVDFNESYSIGERISNTCLFARNYSGSWNNLPADLKSALRMKGQYLSKRIEYFPDGLSGNHIINNARALLFAGYCAELEGSIELAKQLLKERLPILISEDGFLVEGSSHYHFLFTRWLLEIRLLAEEKNDIELLYILQPYLPKLIKCCRFFIVKTNQKKDSLVLFGDISPDCEPEWLVDIVDCNLANFEKKFQSNRSLEGWANLFKDWPGRSLIDWPKSRYKTKSYQEYKKSGWYRLEFKNWVCLWHIENPSGPAKASHSHHDFCSFILFRDGKELIIDPGRYEYENNDISNYGTYCNAHSSLSINGHPPSLSCRDRFYPQSYRATNINIINEKKSNLIKLTIEHDGFKRLGVGVETHHRIFEFTENELNITDNFYGSGSMLLHRYFQWAIPKNYKISNGLLSKEEVNSFYDSMDICIKYDKIKELKLMDYVVADESLVRGWRFMSFGKKIPAITEINEFKITLPFSCSYIISDNKFHKSVEYIS